MTTTIVDAMCDPDLFAPWFPGDSWGAWHSVLKAAFALPMTAIEVETFRSLAGGRNPPAKRVRELWIVAGRRSGKDSIASALAAWSAGIEQGHIGRLRPGEAASVLCLANDRDQSQIVKNWPRPNSRVTSRQIGLFGPVIAKLRKMATWPILPRRASGRARYFPRRS